MDIQWTTEAVEAKAQEMIHMWEPHCSTTMETVLAHHLAYLTASHLQLQEAYRVNVGSVGVRALQSIDIAVRHAESFAAMQDAIA